MHPSSSSPMPSAAAPRHDVLALRDQVVAFAQACGSPRIQADDGVAAATYAALSRAAQGQLTLDDWTRRLLEDRSRELEQRLEVLTARLSEGRKARRGEDLVALLDHRAGPRVIEVDLTIVSSDLAAASVVMALGDYPLHGSRTMWWVREDGEWRPTDVAVDDPMGPSTVGATADELDNGDRYRWVLSDHTWEDTRV